jgi:hypothetical protein
MPVVRRQSVPTHCYATIDPGSAPEVIAGRNIKPRSHVTLVWRPRAKNPELGTNRGALERDRRPIDSRAETARRRRLTKLS